MSSLIENTPTISAQYVVFSDSVVLGAPLHAGGVADLHMFHGVLTTVGQPARPVAVKRLVGLNAATVARNAAALILEHKNTLLLVGLVDVSPLESYLLLEPRSNCEHMFASLLSSCWIRLKKRATTMAHVRQIDLIRCRNITDTGLSAISTLTQLRQLILRG
ncbi:Hypothetical protein, putative, partial [Bodo saltans]